MLFVITIIVIWVLFVVLLKKRMGESFRFSESLLPLVLFSYLITIDLGINYLGGAIPKLNDGIGLHSNFALYIIGDDSWSIELFKKIYDVSFIISIVLTFLYGGLKFIKPKR